MNFGDFVLFFVGGWIAIIIGILFIPPLAYIGCLSVTFSFVLVILIVTKASIITVSHGIKTIKEEEETEENWHDTRNRQ